MKAQKAGCPDLALASRFAPAPRANPDPSADMRQEAVKWGAGCCRRLGGALRRALDRCIRFHELQTIDSYKGLL